MRPREIKKAVTQAGGDVAKIRATKSGHWQVRVRRPDGGHIPNRVCQQPI